MYHTRPTRAAQPSMPSFLRCAARLSNRPYLIDDYFGFRVARTVR